MKLYKQVLCVCSCNELRSPTMQWVLSNPPFNYNTRSCGTDKFNTNVPVTPALLRWANLIVCAEREHMDHIEKKLKGLHICKPVYHIAIPDKYAYRDATLVELITERCLGLYDEDI